MSTQTINSMFIPLNTIASRPMRAVDRGDLKVPVYGLSLCRRSFAYRGAIYYNSLDSSVRDLPSLNLFKEVLKDPG